MAILDGYLPSVQRTPAYGSGIATAQTTTQAPPVTPDQPGAPPAMPGTNLDSVPVPADTLQLGNLHFRQVRALADGIKPEEAAALTRGNGMDEIYFTDETGKHFVAFQEKSSLGEVKPGYLGRYNGKRVKVVAIDDETNTFKEGANSVFKWTRTVMNNTFGSEASKSLSGVVSTAVGSFVAAAALKNGVTAATPLLKEGFIATMKGAVKGAFHGLVNTLASVVVIGGAVIGLVAVFTGLKASIRKGNSTTIDMVTGRY
ncbi:hypothetical protein D3C72_587040 [compost metagenome]